ncbi:hypothetical protein ACWEJP_17555 [Streptomyces sp. NPDC004749]
MGADSVPAEPLFPSGQGGSSFFRAAFVPRCSVRDTVATLSAAESHMDTSPQVK